MAARSPEIAITMPQIMPPTASNTTAWKLKDEAFITISPKCRHADWQASRKV